VACSRWLHRPMRSNVYAIISACLLSTDAQEYATPTSGDAAPPGAAPASAEGADNDKNEGQT
jgi:hypothetical protein